MDYFPVLLVHGWKSHPQIWDSLIDTLHKKGISSWNFGYDGKNELKIEDIAKKLRTYIHSCRDQSGYDGRIDIVCHSMEGVVCRYLLEVLDGERRDERVRQLIGIGIPNNGSSMAEIFNHPIYGAEIIPAMEGIFVPKGYDPKQDQNVQCLRNSSRCTEELINAGLRDDFRYRMIVSCNKTQEPDFFPVFDGKTWVQYSDGRWEQTFQGDGIIPHADSYLPGVEYDLIPEMNNDLKNPYQYCHINLPVNPEVIELVVNYLTHPDKKSGNIFHDSIK